MFNAEQCDGYELPDKPPVERGREELVAEQGSAFLCADLAVTRTLSDDHAHDIAHWLKLCAALHNASNREVSVM
ncbi:MAG: zincin-like metallopeptidase domain-containing protein [Hyphomicrobium sp.]